MTDTPYILVGLGNPGDKYSNTRHNIGFEIVDELAGRHGGTVAGEKWDSLTAKVSLWGYMVHLVKPMTFMNRSGRAVAKFVNFYKTPPERLIVLHDDLDMKTGRLKLVAGGGAGGHNGISSIVQALGTRDFYRLKIGIGRPGDGGTDPNMPVDKYVLSRIQPEESSIFEERREAVIEGLRLFFESDSLKAMNFVNSFK